LRNALRVGENRYKESDENESIEDIDSVTTSRVSDDNSSIASLKTSNESSSEIQTNKSSSTEYLSDVFRSSQITNKK
jgi:hypothetical protein